MWKNFGVILIATFTLVYSENFNVNRTAELISTYAKVAHWGATSTSNTPNEGRSSGQVLWTHHSDVNFRGGQNIKRKQPVTYYYSMRAPSSKLDKAKLETPPYKGEVQERFQPRPYFDFVFDDSPRQNQRPNKSKPNTKQTVGSSNKSKSPSIVYGAPPDSLSNIDTLQKPPTDAYSSPFNSYNPPKSKPGDSKNNAAGFLDFPPNNNHSPPPSLIPYDPPDDYKKQPPALPASYGTSDDVPGPPGVTPQISYIPSLHKPPSDTYGPPDINYKQKVVSNSDKNKKYPTEYSFHPPLAESLPQEDSTMSSKPSKKPDKDYLPPPAPDDNSDSLYYTPLANGNANVNENGKENYPFVPPDNSQYTQENGEEMNSQDQKQPPSQLNEDYGPPISPTVEPPGSEKPPYLEQPPTDHDYHHRPPDHSMAEGDLSPPPAGVPYGKIPQYLDHEPNDHDFYHFNHHDVYHEIQHPATTTTTTEAPRAGHYSYYYLGRKLWYIPLYFSVYFIVYVTVLILKSIARHKIQFTHYFDKSRASRQLDLDYINKTVINSIENTKKMYM